MYANAQRWVFRAALNDSNESLEVTETGNAFQTVAAACTKGSWEEWRREAGDVGGCRDEEGRDGG